MAATKNIADGDVTYSDGSPRLLGVEVRVANNVAQVRQAGTVVREMAITGIYATSRNEYIITGADGSSWQVHARRRCCGG